MHFKGNFQTLWNLGFLMFLLFSFTIDYWVFFVGWYKHDIYGLIWSIDELGKIKISRAWNYSNWGFWSIEQKLMKLTCLLINLVIIFCYITCVMINWSIFWDFWKCVFKIWGFWYKLYVQANFVFLKCNWTILNALEHASCVNLVHASYRLLFSILFLL